MRDGRPSHVAWVLHPRRNISLVVRHTLHVDEAGRSEPAIWTFRQYFHIIGTMKTQDAVSALAALAQESRLAVFRLLVHNAPTGLTVGVIGEQLDLPAPTLSFHLKTLAQAGLVSAVQEGRFVRYHAEIDRMNALVAFLTDNCCGGHPELCMPKEQKTK